MRNALLLCLALTCGCDRGSAETNAAEAPSTASPKGVTSAVDRAKAVASQAAADVEAAKGEGPCEEGYAQVKALVETFKAIPGNQANPNVPTRDEFVAACSSLPPDVQRCFLIGELMKDPAKHAECQRKIDALPPEVKAKATALMERSFAKGK
jgi:hypothetical protein